MDELTNIPLIITNFNQLYYLKNLINQWHFYNPENHVYILDNASNYQPLLDYYLSENDERIHVKMQTENKCAENLTNFLREYSFNYYCLSDPDMSIHPSTPPNFLEIFKSLIDSGKHHVGFDLIYENLPEWLHDRAMIEGNEASLHGDKIDVTVGGKIYQGYNAPIDTTFAMYSSLTTGWHSPMRGPDWSNSVRIFQAFHLQWYINPDYVNSEMEHYYNSCKQHVCGTPSAGENNNRPLRFKKPEAQ